VIGALLAGFLAATDPATASVDRSHLEEIYQRPEFARARLRNQGTLEQLLKRLRAWFDSFFESRGAETYSVVTRFLVLLAAALVAGWALLRLLSRRQRAPPPATAEGTSAQRLELDDPAEHLSRGRSALTADPRAALREGLLALLSTLERRRLARPDRVKTNRELAKELPTRGAPAELTKTVEQLLGWYDRTFYSLDPVAAADASRFLDDVERLP
jgi:hypothetical protein